MADTSIAEIIARTICEFDRRSWSEIGPTERHRYFYTARMAQDRIRNALLNGASGQRMASDLIGGSGSGDAAQLAAAPHGAASDRRLH